MELLELSTLFQQGSRFWSARPWDPTQSTQHNLSLTQLTVNRFKKCAHTEGLDGLILTMPPKDQDVHKQFQLDPTHFSVSAQETEGLAMYIIKPT